MLLTNWKHILVESKLTAFRNEMHHHYYLFLRRILCLTDGYSNHDPPYSTALQKARVICFFNFNIIHQRSGSLCNYRHSVIDLAK